MTQSSKQKSPVTISDVAAFAGVSRSTVGYALTNPGRLSEGTLDRVLEAVETLGYRGNPAARQLRVGVSPAIGLIVADAVNPFYAEMAAAADEAAAQHSKFIFLANSHQNAEREKAYIDFFESQRVGGILVSPVGDVPAELYALQERGTPFVLLGEQDGPHSYPSVTGDNEAGGRLAAKHLLDQGATRIALVGGPERQVRTRFEGATDAILNHLKISPQIIYTPELTTQAGAHAARIILQLESRPDAIFAGNDLLALGLLHELILAGVQVPQDILIVGFDDIAFASSSIVPLSSIRTSPTLLAATAIDLLLNATANKDSVRTFSPELMERRSSRRT